jgi:hypothetical protein
MQEECGAGWTNGSGCVGGSHFWVWSGNVPGWPYDGMPCSCGAVKYDKVEELGKQIRALQEELAQAVEARRTCAVV